MMRRCKHTFDIQAMGFHLIPAPAFTLLITLAFMLLRMIMKGFCYRSLVETLVCIYTGVFLFNFSEWIYEKGSSLFRYCKKRVRKVD